MSQRVESTIVIPRKDLPPCECGALKVCHYRDGIESLMDNMGCELGIELLKGPFCPRCEPGSVTPPSQD